MGFKWHLAVGEVPSATSSAHSGIYFPGWWVPQEMVLIWKCLPPFVETHLVSAELQSWEGRMDSLDCASQGFLTYPGLCALVAANILWRAREKSCPVMFCCTGSHGDWACNASHFLQLHLPYCLSMYIAINLPQRVSTYFTIDLSISSSIVVRYLKLNASFWHIWVYCKEQRYPKKLFFFNNGKVYY